MTGQRLATWGTCGTAHGQFLFPKDIKTMRGTLLVADRSRVQRFDMHGNFEAVVVLSNSTIQR
jgi:hypothetical protein